MENSYYNHANRAYFLCKSYLFVKFFVIFLFGFDPNIYIVLFVGLPIVPST